MIAPLHITLLGKGKLAQAINKLCQQEEISIVGEERADLLIDCSSPDALWQHVEKALELNTPLIIGTTGWNDSVLEKLRVKNRGSGLPFLYAPNFSIGAMAWLNLMEAAARLLCQEKEYRCAVTEWHHEEKNDAPSGTAKEGLKRITQSWAEEVPVVSLRKGFHPGEHRVIFDSPYETLEIIHSSRNRQGFAKGAVMAARWIIDQPEGVYHIEEVWDAG
ncbi:MAG: dihydrodipicolinate reductase C-terminal domain-containing protein [Chlamydiota bacterium]|nr:dihydrodipicolinate reductase C-terminal domain-containing protein [Chlamydiota bacterium]